MVTIKRKAICENTKKPATSFSLHDPEFWQILDISHPFLRWIVLVARGEATSNINIPIYFLEKSPDGKQKSILYETDTLFIFPPRILTTSKQCN